MTTDDLIRAMEADALAERAKVEALLLPVYQARLAKKQDEELSPVIKQYIELHDREPIIDGEHNLIARLQRGGGRAMTDVRPLTDDQVLWLKGMGLLDIKWGAFDVLRRAAPTTTLDAIVNTPGVRVAPEQYNLFVERTDA